MRLDLSRRSNRELLSEFRTLVETDRKSTAELLAYVGEVQARGLYRPARYSSMYMYCVHELHMSEDVAWKRTRVARLARRFPVILDMIADGRLHLTAVVHLVPYRNAPDFPQLLEVAAHRTKSERELLLAQRFPRPDVPTEVRPLVTSAPCHKLVPEPVVQTHVSSSPLSSGAVNPDPLIAPEASTAARPDDPRQLASPAEPAALEPLAASAPRARVEPLAPHRFAIQLTVGQATHDKLRRAQELLGHQVPAGDLEAVLHRALDLLVRQLERAKFAVTEKPRPGLRRSTAGKRHIPAEVRRAVYKRDGGRCTFVSDSGHRCDERRSLEYDHVDPFARGGEATLERIRLRCRSHNQHEAESVYGAGFMERKREAARRRADERRAAAVSAAGSRVGAPGSVGGP